MKERYAHNQEKKNNTLIINYPPMVTGGIETCFVAMMKACIARGYRVIWITSKRFLSQVAFDGILDNPDLEIVITRPWHQFFGKPRINFTEEERVVMFTCEPLKYIVSEGIRKKAATKKFIHYLAIPHFAGNEYFPDGYMKNKGIRKHTYGYLQKILGRMAKNDCILGFGLKHLSLYEEYFQISIPDKNAKKIPILKAELFHYDFENAKYRCAERKECFVITSCSRFEFPHKAYLLGLVNAFNTIKLKYPQAVLQIVGDGEGAGELKEKIRMLPESVQKDIHLLGEVTPGGLARHYKNSQLVVGLAGAVIDGVRCGIPALVVRHYHDSCETYGFYDDAPEKTLCEEPGMDIVPFIEACITMDSATYLSHAEKAHELVAREDATVDSLLEKFDQAETPCPAMIGNCREVITGRALYIICSILRRLGR